MTPLANKTINSNIIAAEKKTRRPKKKLMGLLDCPLIRINNARPK